MGGGLHPPQATLDAWASDTDQYPRGQSKGSGIVILLGFLIAFASAVVVARLVARLKFRRNAGVDDALIALAILPMVGFDVSVILGWNRYGVGKHAWDISHAQAADARLMYWTATFCYILSTSLTKISVFCFYRRVSPSTFSVIFYWVIWASIGFVTCYMTVCEIMLFVNCQALDAFWKQMYPDYTSYRCLDESTAFLAEAAISVAQDFLACILPMVILWGLKFSGRQHTALGIIFFLGLFVCACGTVRCVLIYQFYHKTYDNIWALYNLWTWTAVEMHVGIGCACLPSLRLFFTRLLSSSPPATEQSLPSRSLQTPATAYDMRGGEGVKTYPDDARSLDPFANRLYIPTPTFSDFDPGPPPPTPPQTGGMQTTGRPPTLDPKVTGSFVNLADMERPPRPMTPPSSKGSELSKSRATSRATTDPFTGNEITTTPTPDLGDFDPGPPPPTPSPKSFSGKNTKSMVTVASRPQTHLTTASSKYDDESIYQTPIKPASVISATSSRYDESIYTDAGQPPPKPISIVTKTRTGSTYTDANIPPSGASSKYTSVAASSRYPEDSIYVDPRKPPPHLITIPGTESMYVDSKQVPDTPRTEESSRYDDDSLMEDLFGNDDIQQPQDMLENDTDTPIAQALSEPEHVYDPTPRQTMFGTLPANSRPRESTASEALDSRRSAALPTSMTFLDRGSLMERGGIQLLRDWPKRTSSMRRRSRDVLSLMERGVLTQSQPWDENEAENTIGSAAPSARNSRSWLSTRNPSFRRRNTNRQPPRDSRTLSTTTVRDREPPSNSADRFSTATRDSHDLTTVQRNTRFWNPRESRAGDTGSTFIPPSQRGSVMDNGNGPRSSQFRYTRPFSSFRDRDSRASGVHDSYYSMSGGNGSNSNLPARSAETPPPLPLPAPALQRFGHNSASIRRSNSHAGDYGRDRSSVASADSEHDLYRLSQDTGYGDELEAVTEYENEDRDGQYDEDIAAAASVSAEAQRQRHSQVLAHQRELYRQYMRTHRQQRWSHQQRWDENSVLEEEDEDEDDGRTIRLSTPREEDEDEEAAIASAVTADGDGTQIEMPDEGEPGDRESVMSQGESVLMYYAEEKDEESELDDDEMVSEDDFGVDVLP
ncbi:hypothetical protein IWX90DRAFT_503184 [Phyllosticta citrichinensis]|uniref:Rhodopsin domain-containing protein n=1 Tax=Phyllosticta citrichinensis TaxID=1130410 RepID=A0ABR1XTJ6_9PEZI